MASSAELHGRLAVVTGASSGIGRAVALALAGAGARTVLVARRQAALRELAERCGAGALVCAADVTTEEGVARVADAVRAAAAPGAPGSAPPGREAGRPDAAGDVVAAAMAPDMVVHAAGAFELAPLAETSVASFDRIVGVNLRAAFLLVRTFVPAMLVRGRGDVVLVGSVAGRQAFPANGAYSASKFGVRGMHAVLAAELRGTGVRTCLVEPAATDTPLWDAIDRERHPGLPEPAAMLSPDAVADAVLHAVTRPHDVVLPNILVQRA